jgi:hypothetical protein
VTAPDKPRRFARAVAAVREEADMCRAEAGSCDYAATVPGMSAAYYAQWSGNAARFRTEATECEAAADLLEAAEGETT